MAGKDKRKQSKRKKDSAPNKNRNSTNINGTNDAAQSDDMDFPLIEFSNGGIPDQKSVEDQSTTTGENVSGKATGKLKKV